MIQPYLLQWYKWENKFTSQTFRKIKWFVIILDVWSSKTTYYIWFIKYFLSVMLGFTNIYYYPLNIYFFFSLFSVLIYYAWNRIFSSFSFDFQFLFPFFSLVYYFNICFSMISNIREVADSEIFWSLVSQPS